MGSGRGSDQRSHAKSGVCFRPFALHGNPGRIPSSTGNAELRFVFRSSDGLPIRLDKVVRRAIRPAVEAIVLPWRGWHAFRRGLAPDLYAMGAPGKVVQRILRHSRPHVTKDRYIKVFDRTVLEAAENMQKRIAKIRSRPLKIRIVRKRKDDLNRPYGLRIIHSCERIHANDCCLLSSANDGEGRCVLYG